jgi:hypothetical protein
VVVCLLFLFSFVYDVWELQAGRVTATLYKREDARGRIGKDEEEKRGGGGKGRGLGF